jgi:hypothetical protein
VRSLKNALKWKHLAFKNGTGLNTFLSPPPKKKIRTDKETFSLFHLILRRKSLCITPLNLSFQEFLTSSVVITLGTMKYMCILNVYFHAV